MLLDPRDVARALGGDVLGRNVLVPGPGHSRGDRSLSILIDPAAPQGFVVYSFAGDAPAACRDYVQAALGARERPRRESWPQRCAVDLRDDPAIRSALASRLWNAGHDPRGTVVADYLASRRLSLPDEVAGEVLRFHPGLKLGSELVAGMVALYRDITTNEPCGLHRTFLDSAGSKLDRKMLGRARNAAIKLDTDEEVTLGLHIGEGVETCVAAWLAGFRPVWALGSASAIAAFPVLSGIESITVLCEAGDGGANARAVQACAPRWKKAGRDVLLAIPQVGGDLNDVWFEVA